MWRILLTHFQNSRPEIADIDSLKCNLTEFWNQIPLDTIRKATASWVPRLQLCVEHSSKHFEHLR